MTACVPAWVCGQPDSGRVGVWAGLDAGSSLVPTWRSKTQNDTTVPLHATIGKKRQSSLRMVYKTLETLILKNFKSKNSQTFLSLIGDNVLEDFSSDTAQQNKHEY